MLCVLYWNFPWLLGLQRDVHDTMAKSVTPHQPDDSLWKWHQTTLSWPVYLHQCIDSCFHPMTKPNTTWKSHNISPMYREFKVCRTKRQKKFGMSWVCGCVCLTLGGDPMGGVYGDQGSLFIRLLSDKKSWYLLQVISYSLNTHPILTLCPYHESLSFGTIRTYQCDVSLWVNGLITIMRGLIGYAKCMPNAYCLVSMRWYGFL